MTVLDSLADRLETDGIFVVGTTTFISFMPESPDNVISLYESPGADNFHNFGTGDPVFDDIEIQVRVRSNPNDYPSARDVAHNVIRSFEGILEETIDGHLFHWVRKMSGPFLIDRDENERQVLAVNFSAWVREASP